MRFTKSNEWRDYQDRQAKNKLRRERYDNEQRAYRDKQYEKSKVRDSYGAVGIIFRFVVVLLLTVTLYRVATEQNVLFSSEQLFGVLERASSWTIDTSFISRMIDTLTIAGDWGAFDFFRTILNSLGQFFGYVTYISVGAANLVSFLVRLVGALLGV